MRKFLIIVLVVLLSSSALASSVPPDTTKLKFGYYVAFVSYDLYFIRSFDADHGQIGLDIMKNDFSSGHQPYFHNLDMYFTTTDSHIEIRETKSSPNVYASGEIYRDYMILTFDNENYWRFDYVKNQSESVNPVESDPFANVRYLFEDGFTVPAGAYRVGEDLPAGAFSYYSDSGCTLDIQQNNSYHYIIELEPGESFNKYILETGQWFVVNDGSVILKTYHGLFN